MPRISRRVYYRWLRRYQEQGIDGLRDLSRRPRHSPNATSVDVVGKILYLRQNYHFGPAKIAMYLKRYHDVEVSKSGVWRILKRLELNRLPASQRYKRLDKRWKRYEKQLPGHQVQIDVKFVEVPATSMVSNGRGAVGWYPMSCLPLHTRDNDRKVCRAAEETRLSREDTKTMNLKSMAGAAAIAAGVSLSTSISRLGPVTAAPLDKPSPTSTPTPGTATPAPGAPATMKPDGIIPPHRQ